jgi:hypothetical protein
MKIQELRRTRVALSPASFRIADRGGVGRLLRGRSVTEMTVVEFSVRGLKLALQQRNL